MSPIVPPQSTVVVIQPDRAVSSRCAATAAALGADVIQTITVEAAIERCARRSVAAIVAEHRVPGLTGSSAVRALRRVAPAATWITVTDVPPAYAPALAARVGIAEVIVRRGGWCAELAEALAAVLHGVFDEALVAALDSAEPSAIGAQIAGGAAFSQSTIAHLVDVLVAQGSNETLDQLLAPRASQVAAIVLERMDEAGGASVERLQALAFDGSAAVSLRVAAIERLGRATGGRAILQPGLRDDSAWIRYASATATLETALAAGDLETLAALAAEARVSLDVRVRAVEAYAASADDADVEALIHRLPGGASSLGARAGRACLEARAAADPPRLRAIIAAKAQAPAVRRRALLRLIGVGPRRMWQAAIETELTGGHAPSPATIELLARHAPDQLVKAAAHLVTPTLARAALVGASAADSPAALLTLATATAVPVEVRAAALRSAASRRVPSMEALLGEALQAGPETLRLAALLAAMQVGRPGARLVQAVARANAFTADLRVRALRFVAATQPADAALKVLAAALDAEDPLVANAAYELAATNVGAGLGPLLDRATGCADPARLHAVLDGVIALGESGFGGVLMIARHERADREIRLRALRYLATTFPAADTKAWLTSLRAALAPQPAPSDTIRDWPAATIGSAERATAPIAPSRLPGGDVITEPHRPARDPARPAGTCHPSAGGRPGAGVRRDPARQQASRAGGKRGVKPGVPGRGAAVHRIPGSAGTSPARAPRPEAARRTRGAAQPAAKPKLLRITGGNEARAAAKLIAALDRGPDGLDALRALVLTPATPVDVRVNALRSLVAGFDDAVVQPLLEHALLTGPPKLQHAALAGATVLRGAKLDGLETVARSARHPIDVRLRAFRQLKSRRTKDELRQLVEALLLDQSATLRRAALEAFFPSMHHMQDHDVEAALVNLLVEHPSADVKTSAATALGTYGSRLAVPALVEHAKGLLRGGALKSAARTALSRIVVRDPGATALIEQASGD